LDFLWRQQTDNSNRFNMPEHVMPNLSPGYKVNSQIHHLNTQHHQPHRPPRTGLGALLLAALLSLAGGATPASAAEEFRAAWADVFHVGMSSAAEVDTMVSTLVSGRYNAVVVQVLAYMDRNGYASHGAHWKSSILPWSTRVTSSFDPLAYLCTKAHANGIQVHAWLGGSGGGPYRVSTAWPPANNATLAAHPEWFIAPYASSEGGSPELVDGNYSLDMGSPDVQDYIVSIVKELVTNYPIDGINWDDELNSSGYNEGFGYPAYSQASYARSGLARFRINTGYSGTPSNTQTAWSNYRRRFKNELMARVQAEIQSIKTNPRQPLRHTIAPIAYSPVPSSCTFSGSAPYTYFCDWAGMLQNGYVDAAIPQTYSSSTFNTWADRCANCWQFNRQIFSGIGAYLYGNATIASEISYLRSKGLKGYCTYSYGASSTDGGWWAYAAANVNTSTATVPTMSWRDPATATEGIVWGRVTDANTGLYVDDATVTVTGGPTVKTDGNGYYIATLVPATASGTAHSTTVSKTGMTSQTVTAIALAGDVVRYDLVLNAAVGTAPTITTQPQSQMVNQGSSVTFTVAASGTTPFSYQWRFNGASISGATLSSYTKSSVQATDAGSYSVVVANGAGSATSANAVLTVIVPPTITTQPLSQTVYQGTSATFTVAASGTTPFTYQWRFNGANISGATLSSYTKSSAQPTDTGSYSVLVANAAGNATSANAVLTVTVPPTITAQPLSQTVTQGTSATFTVAASGTTPFTYQWRFNGANISGATASSYTRANVQPADAGSYTVVVANSVGSATSASAILTVYVPLTAPSIVTQPQDQTVGEGASATFTVSASGSTPLYYQWRLNGINISGATASGYTLSSVQLADAGPYSVVVSNSMGAATSLNALLTVIVPPSVTTQPISQTVTQGQSVTFSAVASGTAPLTYQWRLNGASISGATASSYTRANVQATDAGSYSVLVSNTAGSAISANAVLTVTVPPAITTQPISQTVNQGDSAIFTVAASGSTPLAYQWRWYGTNLAGATGTSLALTGLTTNQSGPYTVVVTNAYGAATSQVATLTVSPVLQAGGLSVLWSLAPGSRSYLTSVAGAPPDERGMAYNPLTRRVIIVQRTTMTAYVLDGDTGADLWTLNTTGVTGGYTASYYLLMVGVAEDGAVYAGNMTLHGNTVDFTVYRWANDSYGTLPTVAYSGDPGEGLDLRWGDTLDVRGSGANTQIIIGSLNTNRFAVLTTTDGISFTSQPITLTDTPSSVVGVGLAFGAGDTFWCKAGLPSPQNLRQASFSLAAGTAATARNYADPVFPTSIGPIGVNPSFNVLGGVNVAEFGDGNSFRLYDLTTTNGAPVSITATNFATDNDNSYAGAGAVDFGGDRVYALSSNNGLLAMQIVPKTVVTPPAIVTHPASQTVDQGASATFSVVATGTAPLSYQWRFNGASISGATGSSYTRANVQTTDAGSYSVFISNSAGTATSANAVLAVSVPATPPSIASGPQSQTIIAGQNATFTVAASGTTPLSYQWRFNGANISGATASSYTRPNVQTGDAGAYSVVVSNDYGTVTSSAATLTVHFSLTATAATGGTVSRSPDQSSYAPGTSVTLTATPSGSYEFAGWSGDASGTANPVTVVVNGNLAVTANFTVTCDIILDNTDSEVTYVGAWQTGAYGGLYGTDYRFALGSTTGNSNVTYRPNLCGAGYYDVYIWYVTGGNRATNAPWQIVHSGGSTNVPVNQKINGSQWWRLAASLPFDQGTSGYVRVYNTNASSGGGSTVVIADAVRFTYVAPLTAASITTLNSSANPSVYGNAVTLTATVTGSGGTPGGTVTFKDGAAVLGTATLNASGQATFTTSTLSASGSPHSLTAVYGGDGSFSSSSSSALSQVVNPKALTVTGAAVAAKVYDGMTAATITGAALSGVVSGDAVTLGNATSGTFANKNVGAGKAVATAMTLSGANSGNYTLTQPTLTGTITAKALTVAGAAVTSKVYDGTTAATITGAALSGVVSGDAVTLGNATTGTFANKNVGSGKTVATAMTLSGANSGNYTLTQPTLTGTITAKALTVTGAVVAGKVYDGTTAATITGAALSGVVSGDAVTLGNAASGTFADKNVGSGKTVATAMTLSGANSGNYTLTQPTLTGTITAKALTVAGAAVTSKVYDGTTAATITGAALSGVISGDSVTLGNATGGTFADKNVGAGKTVATAMTLSGASSGNYTLTQPTLTGTITTKALAVTGLTAQNKAYDGTTVATLAGTPGLAGVVSGDAVALAGTAVGTFADANVGTTKPVTISGLSLTGADADNYSMTAPTATANITGAATMTTLVSSANPSGPGSNVTFTATVASGAGTPAGEVVFLAGGTPFSTNALAGGVAAASTSSLALGTNAIRAEYAGGGNFLGSGSGLDQVVKVFEICSQTNSLLSITGNLDGTFTLTFAGTPQAEYYVVGSSDVTLPTSSWLPLPGSTNTVTDASGIWRFTVTNTTLQQFYRGAAVRPCP